MNQKQKKFSQINLPYIEEIKSKSQKLDLLHNTINNMIVSSDRFLKTDTKLKKPIQQKSIYSYVKKRNLQPLLDQSIQHNSSTDKLLLNMNSQKLKTQFHSTISNDRMPIASRLITSPLLKTLANDEHSIFSISTMNFSIDLEQISIKDKFQYDSQRDSQIQEFPYRKDRITRSITSSVSTSKNSHDEPSLAFDTLIIGKLYILNDIYPSIETEHMNGIPLAFLGAEKLLRTRIDWSKVQYPLSSNHIEIIIDLLIVRPSFIREIPKVTTFNLYRPLIKTVSGHLFFDHGENKAGIHQCGRKPINRKFVIRDLASIHQREFHIINYNAKYEQRFINLYENLFQIYNYQTKYQHSEKHI
ncbi:unnamed protein product [Rotaria sordida]|uniref:Uncharacterized protein n=2 Tax=Rotaria sordida TaxID=392033 RepID=A0A818Q290_9BILA|nr:unnamed protein product [Rotaria sordida]CAF3628063.1 unnamed protein product [Rotaria sordida]